MFWSIAKAIYKTNSRYYFPKYTQFSRATKQFFTTALNTANQIHIARMNEAEWAVMFQVMSLKSAIKLFPKHSTNLQESINDLFGHLQRYYKKNFDDLALRLGNLVLMLESIEVN
jgi:amino acid permease